MKKIQNMLLTATICALSLGAASCTEEPTLERQLEVSDSELAATKRGVTYEGGLVSFDVTSNVYWVITNADDYEWLTIQPEAGYGATTVQVRIGVNDDASRKARLQIETRDGTTKYVEITQASTDEILTYLIEDFGASDDEKTAIGGYLGWGYKGAGTTGANYRFSYSGDNSFVSNGNPSDYGVAPQAFAGISRAAAASGGNNILFGEQGGTFTVKNFNPQSERNFRMQFAATNPAATSFNKEELRVEISKDGEEWFPVKYTRPEGDGWALSELKFNIPGYMNRLVFRFSGASGYRIDDISLIEGADDEDNQIFDFLPEIEGILGLPATWNLGAMLAADVNGVSWISSKTIFSAEGQDQGSKLYYSKATPHASNVYDVNGGNPRVTGSFLNDSWVFVLPVRNLPAKTSLLLSGSIRSSAKGNKYYVIEYSTDSETWITAKGAKTKDIVIGAVTESTTYHLELIDASTDTNIRQVITFASAVPSGSLYIRLRVPGNATNDLTRFNTASNAGTTRLTGQWSIREEKVTEGLPVTWSFPADGATTGCASTTERFYFSDDFATTNTMAARIDAVRAVVPTSASANMSYTVGADGEIGRLLMYGFALDDYWKFTIPVKYFKADTQVNLKAILGSSASGPKFYIAEYSADGGATWKMGSEPKIVVDKAVTDTETRTISYSYMMPTTPANADCVVDETITVAEAIAEGNLMLRLRVCDAMTGDKKKNMVAANGGTTRIKAKADVCNAFSVSIVE